MTITNHRTLRRFQSGDRVEQFWPALKRWMPATVLRYEPRANGAYELLYVRRDDDKSESGAVPDLENFREGGYQLPLF